MKKRLISLMLVICMMTTLLPLQIFATGDMPKDQITNPFSDVSVNDWYYENVMYVLENGLFNGTSSNEFSPNGTMTRAMYVTVMGRIAEINPKDHSNTAEFTDIPKEAWYAPYVAWAKEKGIVGGVGNGKFNPEGLVTREQMATLTVRFFDAYKITYPKNTITTVPTDLENVSAYAKDSVLKLWACGIFTGDNLGKFNPKAGAKRSEAAALCMRTDKVVEAWFVETGVKNEDQDKNKDNINVNPSRPNRTAYEITFVDGNRTIEKFTVYNGDPLGNVPSNSKTAKDGYTFSGWYSDVNFATPFYAEDKVTTSKTVYAKYEELPKESVTPTSFAQTDQSPNLSFQVVKVGTAETAIADALTLKPMDGSDPVPLITSEKDGVYTIRADGDGFKKGSSYELTLAPGYNFKDKADSIRTASFTIYKEEVANLGFNEDITYIKDTDQLTYTIQGKQYEVLKAGLLSDEKNNALVGSFDYTSDKTQLTKDSVLCIYEKTNPLDRNYVDGDYTDDEVAYVKVTDINGNTIYFTSLEADDAEKLYFTPDTFPIVVDALPTGDKGTVNFNALDKAIFAEIKNQAAKSDDITVNIGDFVALYVNSNNISKESDLFYGEVTAYDAQTGVITYKRTSLDAIEKSMEMFLNQGVKGDSLLDGVDKQKLQESVLKQVKESGFAEDAAFYLAEMATHTDGFRNLDNVQDIMLTDDQGKPLSDEQIELLGIGGKFELTDDVGITVELETDKDKLHLGDGVRLAIGIDAGFSVDIGDEGDSIKIDLNATFVEELAVGIDVKADAKWKKVLKFIPILTGLRIDSAIDLKNYSAVSMNVKVYTVAPEDEAADGLWTKFKGLSENPKWKKTFETIEDIQGKIDQAKGTYEQIKSYKEQLETAWKSIPKDVTNPEEWKNMAKELGQLDVTKELMGMLNMTNETELDAGVADLMKQYSEMLKNESDWIKLFDQEVVKFETVIYGVAIGASADFVIRGNINLALGTNMEYEVGKRYAFWIDVFKFKSGSSQMDLLDERFAFQFYVMGTLGLKMGVSAELSVGLGSTKLGSVGLSTEFGPYVKLYGFFIYEYSRLRPANTNNWIYDEKMSGAMYVDFGLYLIVSVEAQAFNELLEYSGTFIDEELPILTVGKARYYYDFAYDIAKDETLLIKDEDSNSNTGISMTLPESYRSMSFLDLDDGDMGEMIFDYNKFNISLSNRNFTIDNKGKISVSVPQNAQYMTCDITFTWKQNKIPLTKKDISITIPLVWTNLTDAELNEYYTASVRVGNAQDGFNTVWSQRVKKNQPFSLPTVDEIKKTIGYSNYMTESGDNLKYASFAGYGDQKTENLTIYSDKVYDFAADLNNYSITVENVENDNGTKENRTFTANFGEAFDFSSLKATGTNKEHENPDEAKFTKFLRLESEQVDALSQNIGNELAIKIKNGAIKTQAIYADDSILATFTFSGITAPTKVMRIKKGATPNFDYTSIATAAQATVTNITPIIGAIYTNTDYSITCKINDDAVISHQIIFNTNGGSDIASATYPENSVITAPTPPTKTGYTFAGWYSDAALTNEFTWNTMPTKDITLYAKWTANTYTVTLNGNGGTFEGDVNNTTANVTFGNAYGTLPTPVQNGQNFAGWYTAQVDGEAVYSDTIVTTASNHQLYARWNNLVVIDPATITYDGLTEPVYTGEAKTANISTGALDAKIFTIEYKRNDANAWSDRAVNAGLYSIKVSVKNNAEYAPFEKTFTDVMTIEKAPSRFMLNFADNDPNADELKKANQLTGTSVGNNFAITPLVKGVHYE